MPSFLFENGNNVNYIQFVTSVYASRHVLFYLPSGLIFVKSPEDTNVLFKKIVQSFVVKNWSSAFSKKLKTWLEAVITGI